MRRALILSLIALAAAGCDQATKYQAVVALTDGASVHPTVLRSVAVVDGFWRFAYAENTGAAFSMLADASFGRWLLVILPGALTLALMAYAFRQRDFWIATASALILGGAIGNLIDRVRLGYVVDFVQWHYRDAYAWPTFNVADVWIFVGGALWLWAHSRAAKHSEPRTTTLAP